MELDTILVISALIIAASVLGIYAQFKITQIAASRIVQDVRELNDALGTAMEIMGIGDRGEPPSPLNPLIQIFGEALKDRLSQPVTEAVVISQGPDGKFSSKQE